mgnify:CR=1 FL=1
MNPQLSKEQERAAYLAGDTRTAELLARVDELEAERDQLAEELENLKDAAADDSLKRWENKNGNPDQYKEFFFDCFARLAGHYPCPEVSSDYDKGVIFSAIEKGEELEDTLHRCLPFFEDWKDEKCVYKPNTMAFMIRLIRQSLGESPQ